MKNGIINAFKLYGVLWLGYLLSLIPMHIVNGVEKKMSNSAHDKLMYGVMLATYMIVVCGLLIFFELKDGEKPQRLKASEVALGVGIPTVLHLSLSLIAHGWFAFAVGDMFLIEVMGGRHNSDNAALYVFPDCVLPILICTAVYGASMTLGYILGGKKRKRDVEKMKAESKM